MSDLPTVFGNLYLFLDGRMNDLGGSARLTTTLVDSRDCSIAFTQNRDSIQAALDKVHQKQNSGRWSGRRRPYFDAMEENLCH